MITTQKFAANLRAFARLDDDARELVAETAAYVLFQFHAHGNTDPHKRLMAHEGLPAWILDGFKKYLKLGKRDKGVTERLAGMRGDAIASAMFAGRAEKKALAAARRAEKAANKPAQAAEPAAAMPEPIAAALEAHTAFLCDDAGTVAELTADELAAAWGAITALRTGALKLAA